ncbi:MAG: hypothetical protein AAGI88_02925 [Pseudomonadota bacterium]
MKIQLGSALVLTLGSHASWAGVQQLTAGNLIYGEATVGGSDSLGAVGIPALGTGALVALVALVFFGALRALRGKRHSRLHSTVLALTLGGLTALSGGELYAGACSDNPRLTLEDGQFCNLGVCCNFSGPGAPCESGP